MTPLHIRPGYEDLLHHAGLTSLESVLAYRSDGQLDKPGLAPWRQRLCLRLPGSHDREAVLYVKRYKNPPLAAQRARWLAGYWNHGTAWIEWRWLRQLAADNVAAATPVAFGESLVGRWERASALVTGAVEGESLERWAARCPTRCSRARVTALAEFIRRFHRLGYVHRDLYWAHVFVTVEDDGADRFSLIDLHRVRRPRWRQRRWRAKDLAALNYSAPVHVVTRADRVRFLRGYLGVRRLGRVGKQWARRVQQKTARIARHDQKRVARLTAATMSAAPNGGA